MNVEDGGKKAMPQIDPYLPFNFCDGCRFFELRTEKLYENEKVIIAADCYNAEICINAIKLAKREEEET